MTVTEIKLASPPGSGSALSPPLSKRSSSLTTVVFELQSQGIPSFSSLDIIKPAVSSLLQ